MAVRFRCKGCNQKYELEDDWSGETVDCVKCGTPMRVPEKSEIPDGKDIPVAAPHKNIEKATAIASFIPVIDKSKDKIQRIKVSSTNSKNQSPDDIIFHCKICSQKYRLPKRFGGHLAECAKCKKNMIIPSPSDIGVAQANPEENVIFWCKYCGQKYRLPKDIAGQEGECTQCNKIFKIPEQSEIMPPPLTSDLKSPDSETQKGIPKKSLTPDSIKVIPPGGFAKPLILDQAKTATGSTASQKAAATVVSDQKTAPKTVAAAKYPERDPERTQNFIAMTKTARNMVKYVLEIPQRNIFFAAFSLFIDWLMQFRVLQKMPRKIVICLLFFAIILTGLITYSGVKMYNRKIESLLKINIMCTGCKFCEARSFKSIFDVKCSKCKGQVGFAWKCAGCGKVFTRIEKLDEENPIEYDKIDKLKPRACPFCNSAKVKYDAPPKDDVALQSKPGRK